MLTRAARRHGRTAAWAAAVLLAALAAGASAQTADHRQFAALKRKFKDGSEVTRACLTCHNEAAEAIQGTSHWHWLGDKVAVPGHNGEHRIGKKDLINNFCIGIRSNEESCSGCHISYGWKGGHFDFSRKDQIDCIACHDGTGEYVKKIGGEGGGEGPDWAKLARSVAPTSARTCGTCHFNGGGGEAVKHGDLDESLLGAKKTLDVHLAKDGLGFTCSTCHRGDEIAHKLKGRMPSVSVDAKNSVTCEQCHGSAPHGTDFVFRTDSERLGASHFSAGAERHSPWQSLRRNWHSRRIACQTCHIPEFAREEPTRVFWDWSTAGRHHEDGRPVMEFDDAGNLVYWGIKGSFKYGKNVVPTYRWWNGASGRYLIGDKFDPSKVLTLNPPLGGPGDPASKIWPFKLHEGKQPYDPVNDVLIQPHLSGPKGSGAFWSDWDWSVAARQGMKAAGIPFSGKMAFARTEMYWPTTHMVAQGDRGLSCVDCHARASRLAGVPGVYIPGYSRWRLLELLGWLSVWASLAGVAGHGFLRWLASRGRLGRFLDATGLRRKP